MSDSNDPYNTPPAPERFEPSPRPLDPSPVPVHHDVPVHRETVPEPVTLSSEPLPATPSIDAYSPYDERPAFQDFSVPVQAAPAPLEPLPAVAGDFSHQPGR